MKNLIVTLWLLLLFSAIGALFWYNEYVYHLPTPVPKNYKAVSVGTLIKFNGSLNDDHSKPLFLHFFNPDCPCSRFNAEHFKALVKEYGNSVNFVAVVISDKVYTVEAVQHKLGVTIPISFDASMATACGVYSTPQAALLDPEHRLYYRGNYNQDRYCTNIKTSYAKIALTSLLLNHSRPVFGQLALTAYGCGLADCKK